MQIPTQLYVLLYMSLCLKSVLNFISSNMDLYLFNTIINTIWYLFTILFVLYRFTSFFSYIYNFSKFCYKLWNGIVYLIEQVNTYLKKRRGYIYLDDNEHDVDLLLPDQNQRHKSIMQHIKESFSNTYNSIYNRFFKPKIIPSKTNTDNLHISNDSIFNKSIDRLSRSQQERSKQQEAMFFSNYFKQHLQDSNMSMNNNKDESDTITKAENSNLDDQYFTSSNNTLSDKYDKYQSVPLISPNEEIDLFDPLVHSYINYNNSYTNQNQNISKINSSSMLFDSNFIKNTLYSNNSYSNNSYSNNQDTLNICINNDNGDDNEIDDAQENHITSSHIQPINIKPTKQYTNYISQSVVNTHTQYLDPYDDEITKNPYI
jgi:hypothetical protein